MIGGRRDKVPAQKIEAMVKARRRGMELQAIAENFGLHKSTACRLIRKAGEPAKHGGGRKPKEELKKANLALKEPPMGHPSPVAALNHFISAIKSLEPRAVRVLIHLDTGTFTITRLAEEEVDLLVSNETVTLRGRRRP